MCTTLIYCLFQGDSFRMDCHYNTMDKNKALLVIYLHTKRTRKTFQVDYIFTLKASYVYANKMVRLQIGKYLRCLSLIFRKGYY